MILVSWRCYVIVSDSLPNRIHHICMPTCMMWLVEQSNTILGISRNQVWLLGVLSLAHLDFTVMDAASFYMRVMH